MIVRNDDVNPSTDLENLYDIYSLIKKSVPNSRMLSGITLFGEHNSKQAVYPDLPLKDKPNSYLYDTDRVMYRYAHVLGDIASHGMFHVKHSKLSKDAQEMSIVGSCRFLGTDQFIAPFNDYNEDTVDVCAENDIELITKKYNWKSFEHNQFDSSHSHWYFHSWKWDFKSLREYLRADVSAKHSLELGQL